MKFELVGFELLRVDGDGASSTTIGYVRHQADAEEWARQGSGWHRWRPVSQTFELHDNLQSLEAALVAETRARALAKLSAAERAALGV